MNRPPMYSLATGAAGLPDTRALSSAWFSIQGINPEQGVAVLDSIQTFAKAPADESWVYRCVMLKAAFAQGIPLRVYVKDGRERIPAGETTNGAAQDLQGLLDEVNPLSMNGGDLKAYSSASVSVWGENYLAKVRGTRGFGVKELWWLRAPAVTPKPGATWIDSYDYRDRTGVVKNYKPQDVIPWRTINLEDPMHGLSPLSAARYAISINRQAEEAAANLLANWSVPPGAWVIPSGADFTPTDRSLVKRALRALRGPRGAGSVPILPQGLDWKSIALTPQDQQTIAHRKLSRMTVCAALGVPLVLAGDDEKSSVYANLRDAERVFARSEIGNLDWVADGYNGWLVPDFDPRPRAQRVIEVGFDYTQIEALQAPLEDRKRVSLAEIQHGALVGDEYRAMYGTGAPLPNGEGQVVTRLSTLIPISGPNVVAPPPPELITAPADELDDAGSDVIRAWGRDLYKHPAVRSWLADPASSLNGQLLLGRIPTTTERAAIEAGLRRRAAAASIADDLEGVSA